MTVLLLGLTVGVALFGISAMILIAIYGFPSQRTTARPTQARPMPRRGPSAPGSGSPVHIVPGLRYVPKSGRVD